MYVIGRASIRLPNRYVRVNQASRFYRAFSNVSLSGKVKKALDEGKPVVCLESTIITHGMGYPANLRMARAVERVITDNGATPATIAVLNGVAHVGLDDTSLELLAKTGKNARKISRRDLASSIADKATGGTTVSGTMILAKIAGIKVFVTGGIGGVHRAAERTMDISNDLNELSRNDVAVVCAGPKAILDIPLTLEYLETMGVTVTTIGQDNLPAFYSRDSGIKSPQKSSSAEHAARLIAANRKLCLESSVLVCVPIPPSSSIDTEEMRTVIDTALKKAEASGIQGKDTTPFLLGAVSEATEGRSLEANIKLVLENARVGAQIAVHLSRIESDDEPAKRTDEPVVAFDSEQSQLIASSLAELEEGFSLQGEPKQVRSVFGSSSVSNQYQGSAAHGDVLVVGGVAVDVACHIDVPIKDLDTILYSSTPGTVQRTVGGVAGNIARAVVGSGTSVTLASVVGGASDSAVPDVDGQFILEVMSAYGMNLQITTLPHNRSATYTCVQAQGELLVAVADMDLFVKGRDALRSIDFKREYKAIIFDANIPNISSLLPRPRLGTQIVCFEPTSVNKASTIFSDSGLDPNHIGAEEYLWPHNLVNMTTPNIHELKALFSAARATGTFETAEWWKIINSLDIAAEFRLKLEHFLRTQKQIKLSLAELGVIQQAIHLLPIFENIYVTLGSSGVLSFHLTSRQSHSRADRRTLYQGAQDCQLKIIYHEPTRSPNPSVSDTGAGDTFTGVLVCHLLKAKDIQESVKRAQEAAVLTLESCESVSPRLETIRC